jgi:glutaminase
VQSCAKPVNYAIALNDLGHDIVHEFVSYEPSGSSFNAIKLGHKS